MSKSINVPEAEATALRNLKLKGMQIAQQLGQEVIRHESIKRSFLAELDEIDQGMDSLVKNLGMTLGVPKDWMFDPARMCFFLGEEDKINPNG